MKTSLMLLALVSAGCLSSNTNGGTSGSPIGTSAGTSSAGTTTGPGTTGGTTAGSSTGTGTSGASSTGTGTGTGSTSGGGNTTSGTTTGACSAAGLCATTADCCAGGVCAESYVDIAGEADDAGLACCADVGSSCDAGQDGPTCCSGECMDGLCRCADVTEECFNSASCCAGEACMTRASGGTGPLACCQMNGSFCVPNVECCSGDCLNLTCICVPDGGSCGVAGLYAAAGPAACCSGICGDAGVCN